MKPYSYEGYGGLHPDIFFWSMIGFSVLMFAVLIYEETRHKEHWTRGSWIRIISSVTLWLLVFGIFVSVDVGKDKGLENATEQLKGQIEDAGLTVTSGVPDPSPSSISQVNVAVQNEDGENTPEDCSIYSPDDTNKEISVLCGNNANGMTPENLVKWYEDGSPTEEDEIAEYMLTDDEVQSVIDSVTIEQATPDPNGV